MLQLPERNEMDEVFDPSNPVIQILTTAAASNRESVEILRVIVAGELEHWLKLETSLPVAVSAGSQLSLQFRVYDGLRAAVSGRVEVFIAEGGLTAIRTVRLSVWPDNQFGGFFGVDFGSSRIAAAFIDPKSGPDPQLVVFDGDERFVDSTFAADFSAYPPRWVNPKEYLQPGSPYIDHVFFRPSQFLKHTRERAVFQVGQAIRIDEADSAAWTLAAFIRRVGRSGRPGLPRQITVAMSARLTPGQVERFRESVNRTIGPRQHVNPPHARDFVLDECTATAFNWVHTTESELVPFGRDQDQPLRILVIDAGASGVDLSLLELYISMPSGKRPKVTPRQVAKDGFNWMAGDRVTAALFRLLKRKVSAEWNPTDMPSPDASAEVWDRFAERVIPTKFGNLSGAGSSPLFNNFLSLWNAAESFKLGLTHAGHYTPVRLVGLLAADGTTLPTTDCNLSNDEVFTAIAADVERCLRRMLYVLAGESGGVNPVDYVILTGAAADLPAFREKVITELLAKNDAAAADLNRLPTKLVDWVDRGKEVVAMGAALAAYYRDHAPDAGILAGDRLVFDVDRLRRDLPFSLLMLVAGRDPTQLLRAGRSFELAGDELAPLIVTNVAWQKQMMFRRCAGGGAIPVGSDEIGLLTQYMGHADLPPEDRRPVRIELLPDHRVQVVTAAGQVIPVDSNESIPDPVDEPFAGRL